MNRLEALQSGGSQVPVPSSFYIERLASDVFGAHKPGQRSGGALLNELKTLADSTGVDSAYVRHMGEGDLPVNRLRQEVVHSMDLNSKAALLGHLSINELENSLQEVVPTLRQSVPVNTARPYVSGPSRRGQWLILLSSDLFLDFYKPHYVFTESCRKFTNIFSRQGSTRHLPEHTINTPNLLICNR